jgi:hypothetical protein
MQAGLSSSSIFPTISYPVLCHFFPESIRLNVVRGKAPHSIEISQLNMQPVYKRPRDRIVVRMVHINGSLDFQGIVRIGKVRMTQKRS